MRLPSSKRGPLELEGAAVSRITSFTSHAQLNRHRISRDLDWNRVLPRQYDEGRKRKGIKSIYCCLVTQSCPTLCDPMDCSTPGFSVLHHLPELGQTHAHWVSDAIQPSPPLLSPSPAFNISQHQGLYIKSIHKGVIKFQPRNLSMERWQVRTWRGCERRWEVGGLMDCWC